MKPMASPVIYFLSKGRQDKMAEYKIIEDSRKYYFNIKIDKGSYWLDDLDIIQIQQLKEIMQKLNITEIKGV